MQTREFIRKRDYERFEDNRRFEEKTDIAERLGYPIDITIDYGVKNGAVYALSDTVERPFHNQTLQAKLAGETAFTGDQAFERTRLALEHEEALMVDQLAVGLLPGNVLIKFSKVPDAVAEGRTSIKGYRRDLLRSFVRMYFMTDRGVSCRIFTLDHNNATGIEGVGELIGIDTTRPSEEVLGEHTLINVSDDPGAFVAGLTERVIQQYDFAIHQDSGRQTYAGSAYTDQQDAMQIIELQPELITQHLEAISFIMDVSDKEKARERTAAAIKLASAGHQVTSLGDAAVSAEVASGNYGGECATASSGMNQASQSQNMENRWSYGECQVCFAKTMVGSCMVCSSCANADDRGVDLLKLREKNLQRREKVQRMSKKTLEHTYSNKVYERPDSNKLQYVKKKYGVHAVMTKKVEIGGAKEVVLDYRTKEVLSV